MIGQLNLEVLFEAIIKTGLVKRVYHSVIIRDDSTGNQKPSAPIGDKFLYCGINDVQRFIGYCRVTGPLELIREELIGAGSYLLKTRIPHRLVFYAPDERRNHDALAGLLLNAVMSVPGIHFSRLYTEADSFIRQEQPTGNFKLRPFDFYIAIDFYIQIEFRKDNCIIDGLALPELCKIPINPFALAPFNTGAEYNDDFNNDFTNGQPIFV